jgi:tight adherence protein B
MLQEIGGGARVVLPVVAFIAAVLLLEGLYLMWRSYKGVHARRIGQRLQVLSAAADASRQSALLRERMLSELPPLARLLLGLPRVHQLDRLLLQASLDWTVSRLLLSCAASGLGALLLARTLLHQPMALALILGAGCGCLPLLYVLRRRASRLARLERQLPAAFDLLGRALRAGHALGAGLQMIGQEMSEPVASEFRFTHEELNFGVGLEQALTNLSTRVPITDLRYFVVAVLIQREAGGNLAEVLAKLAELIRQRLKLFQHIRVLSAEGRLSAWVLGLMPFALAALMNAFNPQFMAPLWHDPIGIAIVRYMLALMALGVLLLHKLTRIRV